MKQRVLSLILVFVFLCGLLPAVSLFEAEAATNTTNSVPNATVDEIDTLFQARSEGQHPRIFADADDFSRVRKLLQTDSNMKVWYARIYDYCVTQLEEPVCEYEIPDGVRMLSVSRKASYRITWMAFLYQVSGERRFADRAVEEMLAVSAFPDWHPSHFLDVAQMAYGVGIGYDWLYYYMSASQRKTVETALYEFAVGIEQDQSNSTYLRTTSNWNPWCNAGLSIAACAIYESYPTECSYILSMAVTNVQNHISTLAPSGSFAEGPGYYQLGAGFMVILFETLNSVLGTDFGLSDMQGVKESGQYLLAVNGNTNCFNFGDGNSYIMDGAMLHWYAKRYTMPELSVYQCSIQSTSVMYDEYLSMLWYDPDLVEGYSLTDRQLDHFLLSDTYESIASFRSFAGDAAQIYAAIKSGENNNSHTDLDVGTFVLEAMGERWFTEMGSDNYNLSGYSSREEDSARWTYYRKRAEGQNTLVINPDTTGGQVFDAQCQIVDYESSYDGGYAVVDMLDAYDAYGVTSIKRGMLLFDDRSRVLLRDEITTSAASEIYWFAHTQADITVSSDGRTAELTQNGKTLIAQITEPSDAVFTVMDAEPLSTSPNPDGQNSREGYQKLVIHLQNVSSPSICVIFTPVVQESDRNKVLPTAAISEFDTLLSAYDSSVGLTANESGIYEIYNTEQLMLFAEMVNSGTTFEGNIVMLMNDIDLKGRTFTPIGGCGTDKTFRGTFDGGYHVIRNLYIYEPSSSAVGLFGRAYNATIKNLGIESGTVFCGDKSAAMIGLATQVTLDNCFNKAKVISSAGHNGGLIGQLSGAVTITNCYNNADIKSEESISGGIVGYAASKSTLTLTNCYHVGTLSDSLGRCGMIGFYNTEAESLLVTKVTVTNCYSTTPIKSEAVTDNSALESFSGNEQLASAQMVSAATSLGSSFIYDCEYENAGYPVLQWQCDTVLPDDLVLTTSAQLRLLAYNVNSGANSYSGITIKLANDIDLDSREWVPIGGNTTKNSSKGKIFKGIFDAQGYTIKNLSVTTGRFYVGFFGSVQGTIRNLGIESGRVIGNKKVAGIAGYCAGTVSNCYNRASITGNSHTGGLVGVADAVTFENCYNNGTVNAELAAGGLVGWFSDSASNSSITNCYNAGKVTGSTVGALAVSASASASGITFTNCHALSETALIYDSAGCTLASCTLLNSDALKSSSATLGASYTYDNAFPQNGGYPILLRFVYSGAELPALDADSNNVYHINTAEQLRAFAYMVNVDGNTFSGKTVRLTADIDLNNEEWVPIGGNIGAEGQEKPYFAGTFDGGGHEIRNLCVSSGNLYVGLFGYTSGATIENLGIESGTVIGTEKVGGIVGSIRSNTVITGCYNRASISGRTAVGGMVGMIGASGCSLESCYNTGNISANNSVGGIAGYLASDTKNTTIQNCYNTGTGSSGIIGVVNAAVTTAQIINCYTIDTVALSDLPNSLVVTGSAQVAPATLRTYAATLSDAFAEDFFVQNKMFPVLAWENADRSTSLAQVDGIYQITCADDLRLLSYLVRTGNTFSGKQIELRADIDLENKAWLPIGGYDETKSYVFKGTFDGRGYTINNLYSYEPDNGYAGLFGSVSAATIKNVGLESSIVIGSIRSAGIAAVMGANSTISNCYNKATVYAASNTGGFVGMVNGKNCSIENCYNVGNITAKSRTTTTGGLIGYLSSASSNTTIRNCYNVGNVYGFIGSVNASATGCIIQNCYTAETVDLVRVPNQLENNGSAQISSDALKDYASVLGDAYDLDSAQQNNGYPVLTWETGRTCYHEYIISSTNDATYHTLTCTRCADSMTEDHSFIFSTGTETTHKRTCETCGYSDTVSHTALLAYTENTDGTHNAYCSYCLYTANVTHTWSLTSSVKETCTTAGTYNYQCTLCTATKTESTDAIGHDNISAVTAPTCTENGYTTHTCTRCGNSCIDSETSATGHSYGYGNNGEDHTATCANCGESFTEAHSYVDGICVCGAVEVVEPTLDSNITINHTLNLASDISIIYAVKTSLLTDYDSYYLECVLPTYEGSELVGTTTVIVEPVLTGSYYYFTLTGVTAVQMNDLIEATLHMTKDSAEYISNVDTYSVATYAYSQLNKTAATDTLKALCADLLRYGAAAQTYKSYRTDALVDAAMTEEQLAYLSDIDAVAFGNNNTTLSDLENPSITWAGKVLNLESKVELKFVINTASYTGNLDDLSLHVSYNDYTGAAQTAVITEIEAYNADRSWYAFSFDGLLAAELRQVVSIAVYEGNTQVSPTLQYSADTYGNNKTGTLLDLCKALFAYSDTALAYFSE